MAWTRYQNNSGLTGLELYSETGATFTPRSYCDDPTIGPVGIYVTKEPACKLLLNPIVQFVNTNIAWDISQSRSATSTINTYDITWGGTTDIGNLTGQSWAGSKTGNVQYTTAGTYTVTAFVTDVLGKRSKEVKITVIIISEFDSGVGTALVGTTDGGLYVVTSAGSVSQFNTGLSAGHLNFRSMRLHPAYKELDEYHVWACTQDGLAYLIGSTWIVISKATLGTPENAENISPAPVSSDLDQIDIAFSSLDPNYLYVLRTTATRAWLYYSTDYGATWSNKQVRSSVVFYDPVSIEDNGNPFSIKAADVDTNKITVSWRNNTPSNNVVAIDISTATVGTKQQLSTSAKDTWLSSEIQNKSLAAYIRDDAGADHGFAVVATVSGTSISLGSEGSWLTSVAVQDFAVALNDGGNRALIASRAAAFDNYYVGVSVGASITVTDEDIDLTSLIVLDVIHLVQDTWIVLEGGFGSALNCRVVDFGITTVTANTRYAVSGPTSVLNARAARIDNDRFLVVLQDASNGFRTVVGSVLATVISYGSVVNLETTGASTTGLSVSRKSATEYIAAYGHLSSGINVETLTVSGTTVTRSSDLITGATDYQANSDPQSLDIIWISADKKFLVYKTSGDDLVYRIVDRDFRFTHSDDGIPGAIV